MSKKQSMVDVVLDFLKRGERLSAFDAVTMWNELNLRNKISVLRSRGWQILSEEVQSAHGGKFKVYFLDMNAPKVTL